MAAATNTKTALYDCAKCDGTGNIGAFSHVHGGACFPCKGTGKVRLQVITDEEKRQIALCNVWGDANHMLEMADRGRDDMVKPVLERITVALFTVGTDNAREILDFVAAGKWFNGGRMDEGKLAPTDALALRAAIVTRGREISK